MAKKHCDKTTQTGSDTNDNLMAEVSEPLTGSLLLMSNEHDDRILNEECKPAVANFPTGTTEHGSILVIPSQCNNDTLAIVEQKDVTEEPAKMLKNWQRNLQTHSSQEAMVPGAMDEISFVEYNQISTKVDANLRTNITNIEFVSMGDFCQLESTSEVCFYVNEDGVDPIDFMGRLGFFEN